MAISTLRSLIPGQTWLTGTTAPDPIIGYVTQFYLNTTTGEVYQKTNSTTWILRGDLAPDASTVLSVNTKTGVVVLRTGDIEESGTNQYFTDARAVQATIVDSTAGMEINKAPSVHAAKEYTTNAVASEAAARATADALLIPLSQKGVADGVATLDSLGKIPATQIPPTAITSVTVVETIAERDALSPGEGDFCVVTDVNETFVYNGADWIQLETGSAVISVANKTGAVSLNTDDITEASHLYFTDSRAKLATIIDSSAGSETDKAMSVAAAKMYTDDAVEVETLARQAADALLIPLTQKGAPFGVAVLDADGKIDVGNLPGATSDIGTPTRGTYDGGLLTLTPTTSIADATDETNLILAKLAPAKPPNLSTKTISLTSSYSAKEADTNILRSNVTDSLRPQISTVSTFYDGDNGTLSAEIDAVSAGSIVLTPTSEAGTYGALVVTSDVDYYAGQAGKEGFWRALSAYILPTTNLTYGVHTYQMKHTTTGNTNLLNLYVDNPTSPTISGETKDLSSVTTSYVSGVPTLSAGSQIKVSFTVDSAVGKFFNSTKVADITGSNTSTTNISPDAAGYAENASITVTNANVSVNSSSYSESPSISMRGYNSKTVSGTSKSISLGSRIDTVSNETVRKVSGSGQYPATGYGGTFDSTQSLKSTYYEELQMLAGYYQRPAAVNYSSNTPVAGPDYSTGMGTNDRWVTFLATTLSTASAFSLTINGISGSWSGTETTGIQIYAKVEGVTGWINCNAAYPGVGNPTNDGDPALVFGSSSTTLKRVTFGSAPRSGTLYIRIGLPSGSDKKFTSISISNIL